MSPSNLPRTVGELRAAGHRERGVKQEIRENLLTALADGDNVWPGILGFDDTVIPQVERALIAGHDFVLLGERGQGKTRLLRALAGLLDEWTPVIAGAELGEHPYTPITPESIRRAAQLGDDLPVAWKHRSETRAGQSGLPGPRFRRPVAALAEGHAPPRRNGVTRCGATTFRAPRRA